ncbi:MAG: hypothetical protein ACOY46_17840 [Bacillota bacterium]
MGEVGWIVKDKSTDAAQDVLGAAKTEIRDTAKDMSARVKSESNDAAKNIRSWFDSIKRGAGLWDEGKRRRRTRRGVPGAGRNVR